MKIWDGGVERREKKEEKALKGRKHLAAYTKGLEQSPQEKPHSALLMPLIMLTAGRGKMGKGVCTVREKPVVVWRITAHRNCTLE